ncbi:MAG TPA: sigma-70 family RNA polymerase sigma factor [Chitinophagaceae bacterium]
MSASAPKSSKIINREKYRTYTERNELLSPEELTFHIGGCVSNDRVSQKKIYNSFYGYTFAICNCYTNNHDDAVEILNDGFLKIFKEMYRYSPAYDDVVSSFKGWIRKIMIYSAIDHFRRNNKYKTITDFDGKVIPISPRNGDTFDLISYKEIIQSLQKITPGYRTVLCLFAIEGFTHEEISRQLGISVGTSKSNLAKGRRQLRLILAKQRQEDF